MNNQIAIVTLLTVIVAATAYDFNDPLFNQILADQLEELHSSHASVLHPRNRRDEEAANADKCKPWRRKKLCCAEETLEEVHEREKEFKKECFKTIMSKDKDREMRSEVDPFRCDRIEKHRKDMTCVFQCVGQKINVLDESGNTKDADFATHVKTTMSKEAWFGPLQDKVISTCLSEAKNATANRDPSDTDSCNPAGIKIVHCLFREIQLGCPAEEIKDQKACNRARDKIKRHNDFFPPPSADDE